MTSDPRHPGGRSPAVRRADRVPAPRDAWREPLRAQRDPVAGGGRPRVDRQDRRGRRTRSRLGTFVATYGWRAYALPLLAAITVAVGVRTLTGTGEAAVAESAGPAQGPPTFTTSTDIVGAPPKGLAAFAADLPTGMLPDGGPFTEAGAGTWRVVPGQAPQVGQGSERVFRYTVEVEDGVDTASYGGDDGVAAMVSQTLANPKSWTHDARFAFVRLDAASAEAPDFRVSLTTPMTIRGGCGYEIPLEASCYNPAYGTGVPRVLLNEARWVRGAMPFQGDVGSYRQYLVNHEVGHAIGYPRHEPCAENGALAPVMMQQTFSTDNDDASRFDPGQIPADGRSCRFNPWPYPIA